MKDDSKSWKSGNRIFYTSEEVEMEKCMLLSMATKRQFTIECNIMPNKFSPYDFILPKDFQKDLNFKACVVKGKFTWDGLEQSMVPHGY